MARTVLEIQGMTCGHCAMRVQKALTELPGVRKATVTLQPARASVEYDEGAATPGQLAAAVTKAGYTASPVG